MTYMATPLRAAAGFFGFSLLGGLIWSAGVMNPITVIAGSVASLVSLMAAFVPERYLAAAPARHLFIVSCFIAVLSVGTLLLRSTSDQDGAEWDVVIFRSFHILVLGLAIWRVATAERQSSGSDQSTPTTP